MTEGSVNDEQIVRTLVQASGLILSDAELARLMALYPMVKAMTQLVRSVPVGRDDEPVTFFEPDPTFARWGS
jgi:hypothetical protein